MGNRAEFTYQNTKLAKNAFQCFEDMRRRKEFCDVTFKVADSLVSAHRVVVLAAMPRFREVFSREMIESEGVPIPEVDRSVFNSLVDYAYTSTVKITTENVKLLLSGASRLGIKEVLKACCEFIAYDGLHAQNILNFLDFARSLDCSELIQICENYVIEHFSDISQTEEFLKLDSSFVKDVIESDELAVESEEKVYEAVVKWTQHSPEERKAHLPYLLKCVRMPLLDKGYLRQIVAKEELIRMSIKCRDLLDEAKDYHYEPSRRAELCTFSTQLRSCYPCQKYEKSEIYTLFGELSLKAQNLDAKHAQWSVKKKKNFKMYDDCASAATLNGKVYCFIWKNVWFSSPPQCDVKPARRCIHGRAAAVVNNKLYACGGSDGYSVWNTVQCFDPDLEEWSEIRAMRQCRKFASATTLGECIYVLGGESREGILNSVEKYNSRVQIWTSVPAMLTNRKKFSSSALNGKLYVCGGITAGSTNCVPTAEVYEPITKQWKYISSLGSARYLFSLISHQGKLYVVGGKDDSGAVTAGEIWNSHTNTWSGAMGEPVKKHTAYLQYYNPLRFWSY